MKINKIEEIASRLVCVELNESRTWLYEMSESRIQRIAEGSVKMAIKIVEAAEKASPSQVSE